jgi:hypothetical protein
MLVSFSLLLTIFRAEHIIIELRSDFPRRAAKDRLLREIGVGAYVITVLVPELAVMLIKKDMKVDNESATNSAGECGPRGDAT